MLSSILKKVLMLIPTFFGITLLTFILIHLLPGDPVLAAVGDRAISEADYAKIAAELGIDKPYWQQYFIYLRDIFQLKFGYSFVSGLPVVDEFFARFPATVELGIFATIFALVLGIPVGILAALYRGKWPDTLLMSISLAGYSMPVFWWGLIMVLIFSVNLGWLPVAGYIGVEYFIDQRTGFSIIDAFLARDVYALGSALKHLVLPTIVLGTIPLAIIARMTRSSMLEVLHEDYIRSLRARGLSPFAVVFKHALRNALIPVVTTLGLIVGGLISGSILTESIFSWPGIGKWLIDAINARDYPVIQSAILFISLFVILINLIVDVVYTFINPRAK